MALARVAFATVLSVIRNFVSVSTLTEEMDIWGTTSTSTRVSSNANSYCFTFSYVSETIFFVLQYLPISTHRNKGAKTNKVCVTFCSIRVKTPPGKLEKNVKRILTYPLTAPADQGELYLVILSLFACLGTVDCGFPWNASVSDQLNQTRSLNMI